MKERDFWLFWTGFVIAVLFIVFRRGDEVVTVVNAINEYLKGR